VTITFNPTSASAESATFAIGDNAGVQMLQASGTGVNPVGSQTMTFNPLSNVIYGSGPIMLTATASSSLPVSYAVTGPASVAGSLLTITGTGPVSVTASQSGNASYSAATPVVQGFTVTPAALTVTANNASRPYGAANPAFTYAIVGFVNGETSAVVSGTATETTTATSTSGAGTYPITFSTKNLAAANYTFNYLNGTLTILGGVSQTITFNSIPNVIYGGSPIPLTATASSGLPVTYAVTGAAAVSGSTLTIIGAGPVTVTASQMGNGNYAAATPVLRSFTVAPAILTVTANNASRSFGVGNPSFTYTITGLVNGDTTAVVSGTATEATTATNTSVAGNYPITFSTKALTAANYTFTYVNGTLTVKGGAAQTISFNPLANVTYGVGPIALSATASSSLPVTYTVFGAAAVSGSTLTIIGAGPVTVTASQAGNSNYAAATPVSQNFTVTPAMLTVTANNASRSFGVGNPSFTYTISGLVNGDTTAVVSGTATETTTAITTSPGGTYPITFSTKALIAANYLFNYVNGTLTVSAAPAVVLTTTATLIKVSGGYQATIKITNSGSGPAPNVLVTTATLGAASGSPLPQSLGTLAAGGGSATFTVTFPLSVGTDGATVIEKYAGTYTGGSFTGSLRAVLP
jgi:hypothetical protein